MGQKPHITIKMDELRKKVLTMASLSNQAFLNATRAFQKNDWELAEQVLVGDEAVNALECQLDKYCLELLALTQPMARDLRLIIGSMRITIQLERIGDEAVNLAQRTIFLSTRPPLPMDQLMLTMVDLCRKMLSEAITAYADADTVLAASICNQDREVDELYYKLLRRLIRDMVEETRIVERAVHHIMAAKHLERIGDLCTNIAEAVIFIVKGEDIKHRCEG